MSNYFNPPTRICGTCGKEFICHDPDAWVYKKYASRHNNAYYGKVYFCTWSCMRKWEAERKKKHE